MAHVRGTLLACTLVAVPTTGWAQTPVRTGTTFAFDHDAVSATDTARYELCVDAEPCVTVGVVRVGTTDTYQFTLPGTVPRGNHALAVRAIGLLDTGASGPSNVVVTRVVGQPAAPTDLRVPPEGDE
jgi:hypothetical protein